MLNTLKDYHKIIWHNYISAGMRIVLKQIYQIFLQDHYLLLDSQTPHDWAQNEIKPDVKRFFSFFFYEMKDNSMKKLKSRSC